MPNIVNFPLPDRSSTEEQIHQVIPVLEYIQQHNPELTGFSGECWAAAYAINKSLFNSEMQVVAAVNEAAFVYAGVPIGHVAVHYLTDEQGSDFIDMQGFKDSELIESWGMLPPDDENYIELFQDYGAPLTEESFEKVIWVEYSMQEVQTLVDNKTLLAYVNAFENAKEQLFPTTKKLKLK